MKFIKYLLPFLLFLFILFIYYFPAIEGKSLIQNDVVQAGGALQEAKAYSQQSKEEILWSNSSFSGMPVWWGTDGNLIYYFAKTTSFIPRPLFIGILGYICFFLLGMSLGGNPWISFSMSIAFVFSSFNIVSLEAGHINKLLDMMVMPALLAGFIWCFKKQYYKGFSVLLIFSSLLVYYGHYQIVYYEAIILAALAIYYLIDMYKKAEVKRYFMVILIIALAGVISLGINIIKLWDTQVYSKSSTRGGSELAVESSGKGGLDKEYVMDWSNGNLEIFTTIIPYFYGGSSNEQLGQNSTFFKSLIENNVPRDQAKDFIKNVPLYWGDQPFTSGPVYFGATIFFLFVLAFFIVRDSIKWWILGLTILAFLLSMGKNIEWLSDLCFNYLPLYNKFRAVTMVMSVAQLMFPWLALYALYTIVEKKVSYEEFWQGFKWTVIFCGGILISFGLFGGALFDFTSENDATQFKDYPDWFMDALVSERSSKFTSDSFRSLFFVLATAALLWAFTKEKIKPTVFYSVLSLLVLIDLLGVDFRYLNHKSFKSGRVEKETLEQKTEIDERILSDTTNYRVFNLTKSPFNDATTSYYHKSIGGYSAIKLSRYQDLIEKHLRENINAIYTSASGRVDSLPGKMNAYNMLNTKYVIIPQQNTAPFLWTNQGAMGNAWTVSQFKIVSGAKEEIEMLNTIDIRKEVLIDKKFESEVAKAQFGQDSSAEIKLVQYHPNRLTYTSSANTNLLGVFSEIYYQPGWNAYIDDKPASHFRVNYVLRGMIIPAGKHKIEYRFEPQHHFTGVKVATGFSVIFLLAIAGCIVGVLLQSRNKPTGNK